ncbi:response regulator transcription factor [Paenibacillus sp. MB22_1]|uniref:response regulator transcription factor n=1 Tax=Paenibacillus sp. MB22_1 TaxID=3383121 RepID=UPI0039A13E3E
MTKVLVVDDEASISGAVSYALRREGYTVEMAAYGQEALDQVEVFKPDVMVLDVMMPKLSGYEVCRKLEGRPLRPVILTIHLLNRTVHAGDTLIDLTPKEFDLLALLAGHPGRVYSREALLEQVWDMDFAGGTRTVDMHVQRLRKKLGQWNDCIQTVYGIGYKSVEPSP